MNPEKMSSIDQVIGRTNEDKKELDEYYAYLFSDQDWEKIKKGEIEKTEEQMHIIRLVNEKINELRERYGLERFDIDANTVHLLDKTTSGEFLGKYQYAYFPQHQFVAIKHDPKIERTEFAKEVLHEFLHFTSFQIAYLKDEKARIGQTGLFLNKSLKENWANDDTYFSNLNEAVTEELTKRLFQEIINNNPEFKEETDLIKKYAVQEGNKGKKIDETEIISTKKRIIRTAGNEEYIKIIANRKFGYSGQRSIFNLLIDKIYEKNKNIYENKEEVFDIFAKSAFTGNIVGKDSWGRLIDNTFGKGTLKKLAENDRRLGNIDNLKKFVEELK